MCIKVFKWVCNFGMEYEISIYEENFFRGMFKKFLEEFDFICGFQLEKVILEVFLEKEDLQNNNYHFLRLYGSVFSFIYIQKR